MTMMVSLLIQFLTLCVALVVLAAININRRQFDIMLGNPPRSLDQRLDQLSKSHSELADSVVELKKTVSAIIEKLE